MSDQVGNQNVGFLMTWLIYWIPPGIKAHIWLTQVKENILEFKNAKNFWTAINLYFKQSGLRV